MHIPIDRLTVFAKTFSLYSFAVAEQTSCQPKTICSPLRNVLEQCTYYKRLSMPVDTESVEFKNSLEGREKIARREMGAKIKEHLELNTLAINTISFVLQSPSPISFHQLKQSSKVVFMLLNRMSNDIRTADLLSWHGYTLQAGAVIADCHESAFSILYVGADDALAQKWIDHQDPTRMPFGDVNSITRKGLETIKTPDVQEQTKKEYINYRQLCWAKHANPILQKWHGLKVDGNQIGVFNGPDTSDEAIKLASWVLEHAAHLAYLALAGFMENHRKYIPSEMIVEAKQRIKTLGAKKSAISVTPRQRWGDSDPFPDQWRV